MMRAPVSACAALVALLHTAHAATGEPLAFVREGRALAVVAEGGEWETADGALRCSEPGATVAPSVTIAAGDFHFRAVLEVGGSGGNPVRILFDEIGEIGFQRDGEERLFTRGFLFGDITRTGAPAADFFRPGEPFGLEVARTGDVVRIAIGGKEAWKNTFEGERAFGRISFAVDSGSVGIREAELLAGETLPFAAWTHPRDVEHALPGEQVDVFSRGEGDCHTYRIPAIVVAPSGALLAFCEGRRNSASDRGDIDLLLRRSHDGGRTWGEMQTVHGEDGPVAIGNPVPVVDASTGTVWLVFCRDNRRVFVTSSADSGATWAAPREITGSVTLPEWGGWYATGPCHGVQLASGRLVVPANHNAGGQSVSHAIFSDDHGLTWQLGGSTSPRTNEVTMAEASGGVLHLNARSNHGKNRRAVARSADGGMTWSGAALDDALVEPVCQGSLLAATDDGKPIFLFSNPASVRRERMTVRISDDEGATWSPGRRLYEGSSAYSDLCDLGGGWFGCLYERDWYDHLTFARFHVSWLRGEPAAAGGEDAG